MQYLKYTHVDYRTRRSVADFPAKNGPDFPNIPGLTFAFAEESKYPTPIPTFYGTIDTEVHPEYDHSGAPIWGVQAVLTETEFQAAKDAELGARKLIAVKRVDGIRDHVLASGFYFPFSDQPGTIQTRNARDMENIHKNGSAAMALIVQGAGATIMEFRDSDDFVHQIPATEMLEMTMAAMAHGSAIYKVSWDHKDTILGKNGNPGIATLEEFVNYSIHSDWPVSSGEAGGEPEGTGEPADTES